MFHFRCVERLLAARWNGPRITFGFCKCPICSSPWLDVQQPAIAPLIAPLAKLYKEVRTKSLMRLEYDGLKDSVSGTGDAFFLFFFS